MATGAHAVPRRWPAFFGSVAAALLGFVPGGVAGGDVLRVGVYQNRPLVFVDDAGRARGVYVDILESVAEVEGWELAYVPGTWQECLDRLAAGRIDLLTGIAFTEEREERCHFSQETVVANWCQVYVGHDAQIRTFLDLEGKVVVAAEGDVYRRRFLDLADRFEVSCRVIDAPDNLSVLTAVAEGRADAGLVSRIFGALNEDELDVLRCPIVFAPKELRFAAPKGEQGDVLAAIDGHLSKQKRDRHSSYHLALQRWLSPDERQETPVWALRVLSALTAVLLLGGAALLWDRVRLRASGRALRVQRSLLGEEEVLRRQAERTLAARERALTLVHDVSVHRDVPFVLLCEEFGQQVADELCADHVAVCSGSGDGRSVIAEVVAGKPVESRAFSRTAEVCQGELGGGGAGVERVGPAPPMEQGACPGLSGYRSVLTSPIQSRDGAALGVVCAASVREDAFGVDDKRLFETLAGFLGRQFEIEALRQERARARQMELLGQLTSGVAHEVRNPINAILATAEALDLDIGADPEYGESIRQIRTQVERIAVLTRDLLDLGRPVREAHRTVCRVADICTEAAGLWRETAMAKARALLVVRPDDRRSATVFVDRDKIHQVVLNLLDNAAQHSPEDREIRLALTPTTDSFAGFQVVDAGTGVTREDLPRLFDPFYTRRRKGTGLGLSIVRHIVESHGGTVSIRNNDPPPGCTADVLLPVAKEESGEA